MTACTTENALYLTYTVMFRCQHRTEMKNRIVCVLECEQKRSPQLLLASSSPFVEHNILCITPCWLLSLSLCVCWGMTSSAEIVSFFAFIAQVTCKGCFWSSLFEEQMSQFETRASLLESNCLVARGVGAQIRSEYTSTCFECKDQPTHHSTAS